METCLLVTTGGQERYWHVADTSQERYGISYRA